ncbi:MAG: hypothetical protein QG583_465 [Patescibacteria group bacterium]|nr:hypothetical protein [Patescibacteria group bacterium]
MKPKEFNPLEQKTNVNVKWWKEYGTPKPQESAESFLSRAEYNLSFNKFSAGRVTQEEFKRELLKKLPSILKSKREHMAESDLAKNLKILEDLIDVYYLDNDVENNKVDYFSETNNDRSVFSYFIGGGRQISHLLGLSHIENSKIDNKIMEELIKYRLNNRNIILLGGGHGAMDLLTDEEIPFAPNSVTNVDPYIVDELIDKNSKKIYQSISTNAESENLLSTLKERNVPLADEVWANFSVPFYLGKVEEIHKLFENIDAILAPGGVFRVYPLQLGDIEKSKLFDTDSFDKRKKAWVDAVKTLVNTGHYNLDVLEGKVMHLQKLQ